MPPELTEDEIAFFATGELPPALAAEATPPIVEDDEVLPPKVDEVIVPDPAAELRTQLEAERTQRAALQASLDEIKASLEEKLKPAPAAAPEVPDPVTDPLGNMMHQLKTVNDNVAKLQTELTAQQQANLQRQQFEQFHATVKSNRDTFEASNPDFKQAYAHIRNLRTEDLRAAGAPEADIPKILLQDELQIAQAALAKGKNPAEEMYAMAKRYGYQPAQPAAAKVAVPTKSAEAKIDQLKTGQPAARQPGKAAAETTLTLESLKDLGASDLDRIVQDDTMWAKIVGGKSGSIF